jgi:hypothetical protein
MSLKIENSRRVAKSRPVCMDLKFANEFLLPHTENCLYKFLNTTKMKGVDSVKHVVLCVHGK